MNMRELIDKATHGLLSPSELQDVVRCLEANTCNAYQALLVIGRADAVQYRELVEKYLNASYDPMLARLALMILCRYWKLTSEYRDTFEGFVCGVPWDVEEGVRLLAVSISGDFLVHHNDNKMLEHIIRIFRDPKEEQTLREAAYCSLGIASGKTPLELLSAARHFDLERDVASDVMAFVVAAERRLGIAD